jgi:hypothetical protein
MMRAKSVPLGTEARHTGGCSVPLRKLAVFLVALAPSPLAATAEPAARTAEGLPQPSGPVVLEVTGNIRSTNGDRVARFDRQMLEALGTSKLKTSSAWTVGKPEFEGVLARDLLDLVGAEGTSVTASALNDYVVTLPLEELRRYPVVLALRMDGEYLKIKDKGPIWIVYPRDQHKELQDSLTDKRWIWQLYNIRVD